MLSYVIHEGYEDGDIAEKIHKPRLQWYENKRIGPLASEDGL